MSALTWFGSLLDAAVGGAGVLLTMHPKDACLRVCVTMIVLEFKSCTPSSPMQLKRAEIKCVRCQKHEHKIFHLSGAGECHPSFMEAAAGSVKK